MAKAKAKKATKEAKETTTTEPEVDLATEGTEEATPVNLTLDDLTTYANIINYAVQKGAFEANLISQVGGAYDKLVAFLQQAAPAKEESEEKGEE